MSAERGGNEAERDDLIALAVHDLAEPLRVVLGHARSLEAAHRDDAGEDEKTSVRYILEAARQMEGLIDGLLSYARAGSDRCTLRDVDVSKLLDEVSARARAALGEDSAEISYERLPIVRCDPVQLTRIFSNLISNSIKFRRPGPLRIDIRAQEEGRSWVFSVQDNGIGIPAEHHAEIFEPFLRVHSREKIPGSGVGLAICRRAVEAHGGRIWVTSAPANGAMFFFTLPQDVTAHAVARPAAGGR